MNAPTWIDGLRVLALVGLGYGVWQGVKNRPPPVRYNGRKYYPLPDGRFASAWGVIVKNETALAALNSERARRSNSTAGQP